jgi:hypothetical protein
MLLGPIVEQEQEAALLRARRRNGAEGLLEPEEAEELEAEEVEEGPEVPAPNG